MSIQIQATIHGKGINAYMDVISGECRLQIPKQPIIEDREYLYLTIDGKNWMEFMNSVVALDSTLTKEGF